MLGLEPSISALSEQGGVIRKPRRQEDTVREVAQEPPGKLGSESSVLAGGMGGDSRGARAYLPSSDLTAFRQCKPHPHPPIPRPLSSLIPKPGQVLI